MERPCSAYGCLLSDCTCVRTATGSSSFYNVDPSSLTTPLAHNSEWSMVDVPLQSVTPFSSFTPQGSPCFEQNFPVENHTGEQHDAIHSWAESIDTAGDRAPRSDGFFLKYPWNSSLDETSSVGGGFTSPQDFTQDQQPLNIQSSLTTLSRSGPVPFRDFVDGMGPPILLAGLPVDIESLRNFVGDDVYRQHTSSHNLLCALYALEISLRTLSRTQIFQSPTFGDLREIHRSSAYGERARALAQTLRDESERDNLLYELMSNNYLSAYAIHIILELLGEQLGKRFTLGICVERSVSVDPGVTENPYDVYRPFANAPDDPTNTVWIMNDNLGSDKSDFTLNHWSGLGPNEALPDVIVTNLRDDLSQVPDHKLTSSLDNLCITAPDMNTPPWSPHITEPAQSVTVDMLHPPQVYGKARRPSHSSISSGSSSGGLVDCEICGKVVKRRGYKKHLVTHDSEQQKERSKHKCPHCEKPFIHPKDARRHLLVHTGERSHRCTVPCCPRAIEGYQRPDHLLRHMRMKHPGIVSRRSH